LLLSSIQDPAKVRHSPHFKPGNWSSLKLISFHILNQIILYIIGIQLFRIELIRLDEFYKKITLQFKESYIFAAPKF